MLNKGYGLPIVALVATLSVAPVTLLSLLAVTHCGVGYTVLFNG